MVETKDVWKKILKTAYINGIYSNGQSIDKRLKLSKSTVDYVLEKLKTEKYFVKERYIIDLNTLNLGKFAWLFISVNWEKFDEELFMTKLMKIINVHTIAEITGNYDYAIKLIGNSIQNLNSIILTIEKFFPEIIDTEVHFANREFKTQFVKHYSDQKYRLNEDELWIVSEKDQNPSMKLSAIAKKYKIHRNTVSNKWNKMWENNAILKKTIELTPKGYNFIDRGLKSFIIVKPLPGMQDKIIEKIIDHEQIQDLFTSIENEIILLIRARDSDDLAQFYKNLSRKCPNIKKTNTIIFLTKKTKSGLTPRGIESVIKKES